MKQCEYPGCYSYAVNQTSHGREAGVDTHLCDVCYWRTRAELAKADGYREGVKAALGVIEGVSGDYCNEWAVDALGSCKSEIEALLTKGENE